MAATGHPFLGANSTGGRWKARLPLTAWLCLAATTVFAQTRVALVSTCGGKAGDDVLALAEAALSPDPNIVLVERAEVQRILQEQKLTRCGLSDAEQAVAVGKLLGVEVFAALETYPDSHEALGLVVFDASSGVRLSDEALPPGDVARMGEGVAAVTRAACIKRARTRAQLRTVCILSVRNAELPRAMDSLCESAGRMLERRLLGSPTLTVLERERLEQVNRERSLPTNSRPVDLLPSLTLLELEFARASESNGVRVTVFLTDATGASLGKIQAIGSFELSADLVESLLQKVIQSLKAAPALSPMDRPREAQRFRQEATFLLEQDQATKALQAAEAAYALDPNDKESRPLLAQALLGAATNYLGTHDRYGERQHTGTSADDLKRAFSLAHRGAGLCLEIQAETSREGAPPFYPVPAQEAAFGAFFASARGAVQGSDDESRREWTELQGEFHRFLIDKRDQIAAAASASPASFHARVWDLYWLIGGLELSEATSAAWTTDVVETLDRVLALLDKFGECDIGSGGEGLMLASILYRISQPSKTATDCHGLCWNLTAADKARLEATFDALGHHPDTLHRLYGLASEIAATVRKQPTQKVEITTRLDDIKHLARETIASPPCQKPDGYRMSVYQVLLDSIDLLPDPAMRRMEYQALFDFMLDRHEYVHWVAMAAVNPQACTFATYEYYGSVLPRNERSPGDPAICAQDLARLQALLDSADCHKLIAPWHLMRGGIDLQLQSVRQSIAEQQPGLIPSSPAPWSAARLLYEASALLQPRVVGNSVWSLDSPSRKASARDLRLVQVPLDGSPPHRYDRIPPDGSPDKFYAAPVDDGIVIFPADAAAVNHLTEANGLPSSHVSAVACCDGKLYAGIGENTGYHCTAGYLIVCELATGRVTVLASSMRKEKLSALDDVSPPFFIRRMIADPARHRVLFTVDVGVYKRGTSYTGVWSIDTRDDRLTYVLPLNGYCEWISQIRNGEILFTRRLRADRGEYEVLSFNLEKNVPRLLSAPSSDSKRLLIGSGPSIPWWSYPPHLIVDGWLWVAGPFSRIPIDGGPREFLPSFVTGRPLVGFGQLKYLEFLENSRQVLAGVGNQLWLLDLKPKDAGAKDASKGSP